MLKRVLPNWIIVLLLTGLSWQVSMAQGVTTAAMNGRIIGSDGEGLPGATVVAVHTPSGTQYATATRTDGRYNFPNMRVGGPYTVTSTFVGYQEQKKEGITLSLGQNFTLDIQLQESNVELSEVVVTGQRDDILNSDRTGAATNVGTEYIERLPTISRSFQDFTRLTPQANGNALLGRSGRFNNIQIDGASNNDLFGLGSTGTPGSSAGTTPISLDAIQEFQVVLAPYDVRQGRFSGGGINAVTRSGTNEFQGSVFAFGRNQNTAGTSPTTDASGNRSKLNEFTDYQAGIRLGGPIIRNKLFFFVNGEITRRNEPLLFRVAQAGETGSDIIPFITIRQAQQIDSTLRTRFNYDPGSFSGISRKTQSNKLFGRLDWNITQNHQLTLRHNFVDAFQDEISNSQRELRFSNNGFQFTSVTNSTVAELKSTFGNKFANNLIIGYSTIRDKRDVLGALFPSVTIEFGAGNTVVAGSQRSSTQNQLNQDVLEITDNFNVYAGKHVFTFGTNNELFRFDNLFVNDANGRYDYASLNAFLTNARPTRYRQNFPLPGGKPTAKFGAAQLGFYGQDEFSITERFKLTGGLRVDIPLFFDKPSFNPNVTSTFDTIPGYGSIRTDKLPDTKLLVSPRFGFNWDVNGERTTQVRGGVGVFTGRVPFVWISNQYGGTGVDFGGIDVRGNAAPLLNPSVPDSVTRANAAATAPRGSIALTSPDFKFPQLLRSNIAIDQRLPFWGLVATFEAIYTRTLNDVLPLDINLRQPVAQEIQDGRPSYPTGNNAQTGNSNRFINGRNFNNVILLDNSNQGYQYSLTAQLQKQLSNGFTGTVAYTFGESKDLYSGTSSTAVSIWEFNSNPGNPNDLPLAYSNFDVRHRIVGAVSYRLEYLNKLATTISLFYNGQSGQPFSYVYTEDLNGDGGRANDLVYVPRDQSDIVLVRSDNNDPRTPDQIWEQLNNFIERDAYLKEQRGKINKRNVSRMPWEHQLDLRLMQDIFTNIGSKRNTLQISLDIINFTNLLNRSWGRDYFVPNQSFELMRFAGRQSGTNKPTFSFNDVERPWQIDQLGSRWQMQLGLRYIFN